MTPHQHVASDNHAGICPEAWAAMAEANHGHADSYGGDPWSQEATAALARVFECEPATFFVFNGTAANALALASLCRPYEAVICAETSHIQCDECGAPEFFGGGMKLLTVRSTDGKLTSGDVVCLAAGRRDVHASRPRAVSITQATETGLVYAPQEIAALSAAARAQGLRLHMDGARFANACVSLGCAPAELSWRAGVDVLTLGGTKNGMAMSEAVLFFDHAAAEDFEYRRKQAGQLASKMRFLAAPWAGVLREGAWLRHAAHANACARYFAAGLEGVSGVEIAFPVQANAVFVRLADLVTARLRAQGWQFHDFFAGTVRFMFAWDSEISAIDNLLRDIAEHSLRDAA